MDIPSVVKVQETTGLTLLFFGTTFTELLPEHFYKGTVVYVTLATGCLCHIIDKLSTSN